MVSIDAGTARPVAFVVHRSQPGTYSVAIDGEQGRFTIVGAGGKALARCEAPHNRAVSPVFKVRGFQMPADGSVTYGQSSQPIEEGSEEEAE